MRHLLLSLILVIPTSASAQYIGTYPPNAEVGFIATQDTEHFNSQTFYVGTAISNGLGLRVGYSHYAGQDLSASSSFTQLTYMNVGENHDFHGSFGARAGGQDNIKADAELRLIMTDSVSVGVDFETDIVESTKAIQTGTTFASIGGDIDVLLSENLNLNASYHKVFFSDSNDRQIVKSKLTWTFYPEQGLSTYVRTKNQWDSSPGSTNYFSPEKSELIAGGLQIRKFLNGLVYTAGADFGSERITTLGGDVNTNPVYTWTLGIQTSPGKKTGITYGVTFISSNASITASAGENYNWYGLYSYVKVPLL